MTNKYNLKVGSLLIHKKTAHPIIITELIEKNNRDYISFRSLKEGSLEARALEIENLISDIDDGLFEIYEESNMQTVRNLFC